jgi:hypothetical protein
VATKQTSARPPTPQAAWVHQIHSTRGVSGSITMVMVFGRSLCFLCGFWLMTHQSDSSYLHFTGVAKWATQACTIRRGAMSRIWWKDWKVSIFFATFCKNSSTASGCSKGKRCLTTCLGAWWCRQGLPQDTSPLLPLIAEPESEGLFCEAWSWDKDFQLLHRPIASVERCF